MASRAPHRAPAQRWAPPASTEDAAAFAETWNGRSWSTRPAPGAKTVGGSSLAAVSCPSPATCTAVGTIDHGTGTLTLAARWQGSRLRTEATPNPLLSALVTLTSVSCPTTSVCTAVGYLHNAATHRQPVAIREAQGGWSAESPPTPPGAINSELDAVSCPTTTACTAVGTAQLDNSNVPLAEVWDGTAWTMTSLPSVPPGSATLAAVSCTAANACTAVGQHGDGGTDTASIRTLAERWNGNHWVVQSTPSPGSDGSGLHGVACTSASACVAVGYDEGATGQSMLLGLLWNGATWSQSTASGLRSAGRGLVSRRERVPRGRLRLRRRATCGTAPPGHRSHCRRPGWARSLAPSPPPAPPSATPWGPARRPGTVPPGPPKRSPVRRPTSPVSPVPLPPSAPPSGSAATPSSPSSTARPERRALRHGGTARSWLFQARAGSRDPSGGRFLLAQRAVIARDRPATKESSPPSAPGHRNATLALVRMWPGRRSRRQSDEDPDARSGSHPASGAGSLKAWRGEHGKW